MEKTYRDEGWEAYVDRILRQHQSAGNGNGMDEEDGAPVVCQPLSLGVSDVLLLNEVLAGLGGSPAQPGSKTASLGKISAEVPLALAPRSPASPEVRRQGDGPGQEACVGGEGQWVVLQTTPTSSLCNTPSEPHTVTRASPVLAPSTVPGVEGGVSCEEATPDSSPGMPRGTHSPAQGQWVGGSGCSGMSVCSVAPSPSLTPCSIDLLALASPTASQLSQARRLSTLAGDSARGVGRGSHESTHAMDVAFASPGTPLDVSTPRRRLLWSPTQPSPAPPLDLSPPSMDMDTWGVEASTCNSSSVDVGALAEQLAEAHLQQQDESPPSVPDSPPPPPPPKAPTHTQHWTARPGTLQLEVKGRVGSAVPGLGFELDLPMPLQVRKALTWVTHHSNSNPPTTTTRRPLQPRSHNININTQPSHASSTHSPHKKACTSDSAGTSDSEASSGGGIVVDWGGSQEEGEGEGQGNRVGLREALVAHWAAQEQHQHQEHEEASSCGSWGGQSAGTLVVVSGVSKLRQWEAALRALPVSLCPAFVLLPQPPPSSHSLLSLSKAALVITTTQVLQATEVPLDRDPLVPTWLGKRGRAVSTCSLGSRLMLLRWRHLLVDEAHKLLSAQAAAQALRRVWAGRGRWLLLDGKAVAKTTLWGPKEHDKIKCLAALLENDYTAISPLLQQALPPSTAGQPPPKPSTGLGTDLAAFSKRVHVMAS